MLFNEVPFLDRFERAAQGRLRGGRVPVPVRLPGRRDQAAARARNGLKLVLHNLPAGDWDAGERGIACLPDRVDEFRDGVAEGDRVRDGARRAGSSTAWPARRRSARATTTLRKTFVANLNYAAAELKKAGHQAADRADQHLRHPRLLPEPHRAGAVDHRRGRRRTTSFVQYDIYHVQRMEGELAATLEKHLARIAHVQLADNPGRNEPGTGEINYALPVRAPRPHRLRRLGRLRIQAGEPTPRPASAGSNARTAAQR